MSRKGENIRKRKDGRWEGRYKQGKNPDGTTRYLSVYGKTYTEVKNKLMDSKTIAYNPNAIRNNGISFEEVLRLWLQSTKIRLKGATENRYINLIDMHIAPELGNYKLQALSSTIINTFLDEKLKSGRLNGKGGLSPAYVRSMSIVISSALKFAAEESLIQANKCQINKPPQQSKEISILERDVQIKIEQQSIVALTETTVGILLALHAGLRIGEICALKWDDIDFDSEVIHIRHTISRVKSNEKDRKTVLIVDTPKTKSSIRDVPITSFLQRALMDLKNKSISNYVVSTEFDFVSTRTFDYRYRKALRQMGIETVNFHSLRHTFATRCVESGMDIKTLSEILGHSNVAITLSTYVHPSFEQKKIQIEKLCSCA